MYVFGGLGNQMGQFHTPAAIDRIGEDFLVLDKALGEITVFRTTEYGRTLNEAVKAIIVARKRPLLRCLIERSP